MSSFLTYFAALAASGATIGDNATLIAAATGRATAAAAAATAATTTTATTLLAGMVNQLVIEEEAESTTAGRQTSDVWSERPDTATLTKGFSIPTYLPPYPDFIAADLPQTALTTTSTSMSNMAHRGIPAGQDHDVKDSPLDKPQPQLQPHMRLHAYDSEQKEQQLRRQKQLARERELLPRRQLSLPSRNVTVQVGQHAYLPCQVSQLISLIERQLSLTLTSLLWLVSCSCISTQTSRCPGSDYGMNIS